MEKWVIRSEKETGNGKGNWEGENVRRER